MIQNPTSLSAPSIAASFQSDLEKGLNTSRAREYLQEYGLNQIPQEDPKSRWRILADQLADPIIYILAVASVLAFAFSEFLEGMAIVVVILISVAIGFFMELQAIRSLEALRKMSQAMTFVIRSGKKVRIKAAEVVPGDLLLLQTGDVVPADARLVGADGLSVKESALTGESIPVVKHTEILSGNPQITDQLNMVFRGTVVVTGSGRAIITSTGKETQLGRIQQMGIEAVKDRTPLEKKLNQLSKRLIWLTLFFAFLIVVAGYLRGKDLLLMIETGVALGVAAIPEGLPIVATVALAQGMLRLSKRQVIIKKLEAVQTLGATNIICTDKTGTLTEDQMKVQTLVLADTHLTDVYQKPGYDLEVIKEKEAFRRMLMAGILCNNVSLSEEGLQTDSIEIALLDYAKHLGYDIDRIRSENPEKSELPFDADRMFMATVHECKTGYCVYVKGAFEKLLTCCDFILAAGKIQEFTSRDEWRKRVDSLAAEGLRILAFGYKEVEKVPLKESLAEHLVFLGIIGFKDAAREDVKATIDIYKKAGIKVVMVTGDHPNTARKIAEEVGLLEPDAHTGSVMMGVELPDHRDVEKAKTAQVLDASVFARVTPEQKLNLIRFYQENGNIVGMIGDGINDVPALKKSDIGIAMGVRGTEAAREAADVILKNDKFTAIELAIRQGRVVFQNIRQFVVYLLSCNIAEILSVGMAALLNLPAPLLPLQILFLNLVTDVFPALALGLGKGEKDIMHRPPLDPKESILTKKDWYATMVYGLSISASVIGIVVYAHLSLKLNWEIINNMAFYTLVWAQLFNVFNMARGEESFFNNEVTQNGWVWSAILLSILITLGAYLIPPMARILSLLPLSPGQFLLTILFALTSLGLAQLSKKLKLVI